MAIIESIISIIVDHAITLFSPAGPFHWRYVVASLIIALAMAWRHTTRASTSGLWQTLFPPDTYGHPSTALDVRYVLINSFLFGAFLAPAGIISIFIQNQSLALAAGHFSPPLAPQALETTVVSTLIVVVIADAAFYFSHLAQHKMPILWVFHKVHHAAERLNPLTALRNHPVDQVIDGVFIGAATGVAVAILQLALGTAFKVETILGVNAAVYFFNIAGAHLRHSHLPLSFGAIGDRIFVSPALHQLHHSRAERHLDRNLGGIFSLWDQLFDTYAAAEPSADLEFGLANAQLPANKTVLSLYVSPFCALIEDWRNR